MANKVSMVNPTQEVALFREQVLDKFYASITKPETAPADAQSTPTNDDPAAWSPAAWSAELELWAFASST